MSAAEKIVPAVPSKDQQEIKEVVRLPDLYKELQIKTHEDCQAAADVLSDAKARVQALEDRRKLITGPLDLAKKSVMDLFRPATDALSALERVLKPKIAKFHQDQEAERLRLEAEAADKAKREREKLEAKAEKLREQGKAEQAEQLQIQAETTVAATPVLHTPKVSGISMRKTWTAEVTNPVEFLKAIIVGDAPVTVLEFKQAELNRLAGVWQSNKTIPGLSITQKSSVASRR